MTDARIDSTTPADDLGPLRLDGQSREEPAWFTVALVVVLLLPLLASVVRAATVEWDSVSDFAILEARVRDVGSEHTPLTGPFSRPGFDHPGPIFFYAAAPVYRAMGESPGALLVTAALVNTGALAWVVLALRRRLPEAVGGVALLVLAVFVSGQVMANLMIDPWNPSVSMVPYLAVLVASWLVARGEPSGVLVGVLAGSWALQSHFGYALPVLLPTVVGVAVGGRTLWARRRAGAGWLVAAALSGAVLWTPVLLDQFTGTGNISLMIEWLRGEGAELEPSVGVAAGSRMAAHELLPWAPWSGRPTSVGLPVLEESPALFLLLPALAVAAGVALAWSRRDRALGTFTAIVGAATLAGLVSVTQIRGLPANYLAYWFRPMSALLWLLAAWGVLEVVRRVDDRWLDLGATAVAVVVSVAATVGASRQQPPFAAPAAAVRIAAAELRADLLDPDQSYIVQTTGGAYLEVGPGLLLDLERHGFDVAEPVSPHKALLGEHRRSPAGPPTLLVAFGRDDIAKAQHDNPAAEVLVEVALPSADRPLVVFLLPGTGSTAGG